MDRNTNVYASGGAMPLMVTLLRSPGLDVDEYVVMLDVMLSRPSGRARGGTLFAYSCLRSSTASMSASPSSYSG